MCQRRKEKRIWFFVGVQKMTRAQAVNFLKKHPVKFAHLLGFDKLQEMHEKWIIEMVCGKDDKTLMAHRSSYKTTCVSIALALIIILLPRHKTMFMRKTDSDVKEVIKQVQKILQDPHTQYFVRCIYGIDLRFNIQSATEITTNLSNDIRGTSQLVGIGTGGSLTGKHFDRIFTDDIINANDRISRAEREKTKLVYQELQNIKNKDGKIINTLTPWHKEDASILMPKPIKFDCYSTGLISEEELKTLKESMSPSLFAANYELRHIASENVIFLNPQTGADDSMVEEGYMHLDSAFYGEDYTAWSIMQRHNGKYYLYGKMKRKHVEDCYDEIIEDYQRFMCGKLYNENNADKGMVGKELRKRGLKVTLYHEDMNKYLKIVTHLKALWNDIIFTEGTDEEYIEQICDYWEDAAHDDAPDSAACLARIWNRKGKSEYKPLWN